MLMPDQTPEDHRMTAASFAPFQDLASLLIPHTHAEKIDGAHDVSHLLRVWKNVCAIRDREGGDARVPIAATLLHDCVSVEKDSPFRSSASRLAAARARELLTEMGWDEESIAAVAHAIEAHSFSAAITPLTLEARILQDADRLDSLGMIGVARTFYVSGRMGRQLYEPNDPHASQRPYDDRNFAADHFHTKLLHLADSFQTDTGTQMAKIRHDRLKRFLNELMEEIGAPQP
ncbi:HD domain-containing protein [Pseudomonas amygdali pv. lachrymans]|uniref:HD domain-containing protein n=2 Tax=Pseudomonas amygdali pv. lachrymans TaxID=53707 RepID=A0AB37RA81_PSEAV|nr:HD domain-containing protein [Pseudomonas amygdali pv. lachrymans]KPC15709.1 HD domain-containing protein [Pseudomonas amygdali pv. lachrymans]RMM40639.1 HD domain-containing protein [Pseudomonas amygdali pv. lachrymans]RMP26013.1 HD domain-containing protein [Pseudomonas amygdali pv. lachrymans]RMT11578.1 HD domain-containing protein [Pseudomonas amygdali pv. lachrymans]